MRLKKTKKTPRQSQTKASPTSRALPIIEHLKELRRRLFYVAVCVAIGSVAAYAFESRLINILLRPSHGQHFIYTSPLGGINFLFSACLDLGIAISVPVIIYHSLRFIEPLIRASTIKFIFSVSLISGAVALGGVLFGYFIGLPAALNFLLHQFQTAQIRPLVTIQSYMSFVSMYLLGSALMFQLPLILIIINRIKPLKPSKLLHYERHLIVFAFIAAFIMNPTPNILDQMIVVIPIILMYQVGILLVWFINRRQVPVDAPDPTYFQPTPRPVSQAAPAPRPVTPTPLSVSPQPMVRPRPVQRRYVDGFQPLRRPDYRPRFTPLDVDA